MMSKENQVYNFMQSYTSALCIINNLSEKPSRILEKVF